MFSFVPQSTLLASSVVAKLTSQLPGLVTVCGLGALGNLRRVHNSVPAGMAPQYGQLARTCHAGHLCRSLSCISTSYV